MSLRRPVRGRDLRRLLVLAAVLAVAAVFVPTTTYRDSHV